MPISKAELKFAGVDDWSRFVFIHERTGYYFCTVDRLQESGDTMETVRDILEQAESLYIKSPRMDFEGEPSHPVPLTN